MLRSRDIGWIGLAAILALVFTSTTCPAQSLSAKRMTLAARLDGSQVVIPDDPAPPSGTKSRAVGKSMLQITRTRSGELWFSLWMHVNGIKSGQLDQSHGGNRTAIQIRSGGAKERGPIIIDVAHFARIEETPNGFALRARGQLTTMQGQHDTGLDPEEILRLLRYEQAYLSVHTLGFPDGEIRGNLKIARRPFIAPESIDRFAGQGGLRSDDQPADASWSEIKALYR